VNPMRERAKEHFPTVLLTLLSIVQALALELLWSHLKQADYLFEPSWAAVIAWIQVAMTLLGIMLIWVIYASNVMRFRWVPGTTDSVVPFFIGLLEFLLIETIGPTQLGAWFALMATLVGLMNWIAHFTMRKARQEGDNEVFFRGLNPATLSDFYPPMLSVAGLALAAVYLWISGDQGIFAICLLLATGALLSRQFFLATKFWKDSIADD
jgi:hypothetical protein